MPEWAKRLGHLNGDCLAFVITLRLEVGTRPVTQRLDLETISPGAWEIPQSSTKTRNAKTRKTALDFHAVTFAHRRNLSCFSVNARPVRGRGNPHQLLKGIASLRLQ